VAVVESHIKGPKDSTDVDHHKIETVTVTTSQGDVKREVSVLGDPETPGARQAVLAAAPGSSAFGGVVRPIERHPTASAISRKATTTSSAELLAANAARARAIIVNEATAFLYVKYGTGASATDYTHRVAPGGELVLPVPAYLGALHGALGSGSSSAQVTEETW
jgi:hypothetical protein